MSQQIKVSKDQIAELLESRETNASVSDGQHPKPLFAATGQHPNELFSTPGIHPRHGLFSSTAGQHPGSALFASTGAHPGGLFWASTAGDAVGIRKISMRPDSEGGVVLDLE